MDGKSCIWKTLPLLIAKTCITHSHTVAPSYSFKFFCLYFMKSVTYTNGIQALLCLRLVWLHYWHACHCEHLTSSAFFSWVLPFSTCFVVFIICNSRWENRAKPITLHIFTFSHMWYDLRCFQVCLTDELLPPLKLSVPPQGENPRRLHCQKQEWELGQSPHLRVQCTLQNFKKSNGKWAIWIYLACFCLNNIKRLI